MKSPWSESRFVVPVMAFIAVLLLLCAPFKAGLISFADIVNKKDFIDAFSKIITSLVLIIGGVLSYIKFFKGRVLKPKIDIHLKTGAFATKEKILHWLEIAIENKGSVAVWNYTLELFAIPYPNRESPTNISDSVIASDVEDQEHLVDVGETAFEHAVIELKKETFAYTFEIILTDDRGTKWRRCVTVKNAESGSRGSFTPGPHTT